MGTRTRTANIFPEELSGLHVGDASMSVYNQSWSCDPANGSIYIDEFAGTFVIPESVKDPEVVQLGYATYDPERLVTWAKATLMGAFLAQRQRIHTARLSTMDIFPTLILKDGSDTMTDVVTPNFKSRQQKGEVIFSPMTHEKVDFTSTFEATVDTDVWSEIQIITDGSAVGRITKFRVIWVLPQFASEVF